VNLASRPGSAACTRARRSIAPALAPDLPVGDYREEHCVVMTGGYLMQNDAIMPACCE
jgi:hypothetical protein